MRFLFTQRAAPFLEVGFDDVRVEHTAGKWDIHAWDAEGSTWSGVEPTWRDVSCEVWEASCEYGRAALTDRFVPGQANVLARNVEGWADPQTSGMRPGRPIRFGVDHVEFGRIIIFRGFIDAVVPRYDPRAMPTVELQCIDALAEVNRAALIPFVEDTNAVPPVYLPGRGETADVRLNNILDRALWPSVKRDIPPQSKQLMEHGQGGQVADLLGQIADSVGGSVWGDREGNIGFRGRDWQMFDPTTPVDHTIGNLLPTDVCPGAWERPMDRASFSTKVIMGRPPSNILAEEHPTLVEANDEVGQLLYGIESFERVDLLTMLNVDLVDLAERTLETRSHLTAPRVRSVNFSGAMGDEQVDLMTTVDVFEPSHYQCRLVETDGRLVFNDRYMATAVAHVITAAEWTLDINMDLARSYAAIGSRWDEGLWDEGTWSDAQTFRAGVASLRSDLERLSA